MDMTFTDTSTTQHTTALWSIEYDREPLLLTLQQATRRANSSAHEVLASFTLPVPACDPLHMFSAFKSLDLGAGIFWERPSEGRALVGVGSTITIETTGSTRVTATAALWRAIQRQAVVANAPGTTPIYTDGPVLLGGFAFDPLNPHTSLWDGFPDGLLILPRLLFHCDENSAALTINLLIQPCADIDHLSTEINSLLDNVQSAIKKITRAEPVQIKSASPLVVEDLLSATAWKAQVANAVQMIRRQTFDKVVLARAVRVTNPEQAFDIATTLYRLRESYPGAYVFAIQRGERYFVGATPERLVCGSDGQIQTMALAGSAPRGITEEEDDQLGNELLNSQKNQGEHHVVVATIQKALASLCSRVWVGDAPHLLKLKNIQHLQTPISGDLLPGHSILEAIEDLHPTPAVGGFPRQPALEAIRTHEQLDRGWYAAPIGWIGTHGNGEFAVALRSGLIQDRQATLFAGCGIVADSDPESEYAESCLKLQVMLRGLGGEE